MADDVSPIAKWVSFGLHRHLPDLTEEQHDRIARLWDEMYARWERDTRPHELVVWRARAEAYGTRMSLAERVVRSLDRSTLTDEQLGWVDAWEAEWRLQTHQPKEAA